MIRSPLIPLLTAGVLAMLPALGWCQPGDEPLNDALTPPPMRGRCPQPAVAPTAPNVPQRVIYQMPVVLPQVQAMQAEYNRLTTMVANRKAELKKIEARLKAAKEEVEKLETKAKQATPKVEVIDAETDKEFKDVLIRVQECRTGSFLFGLGVNSDTGLQGSIAINEHNYNCPKQCFCCTLCELLFGKVFCSATKPCWMELLTKRCAAALRSECPCCKPGVCGKEETQEEPQKSVPSEVEKRLRELEKKVELVEMMQRELAALREKVNAMPQPIVVPPYQQMEPPMMEPAPRTIPLYPSTILKYPPTEPKDNNNFLPQSRQSWFFEPPLWPTGGEFLWNDCPDPHPLALPRG